MAGYAVFAGVAADFLSAGFPRRYGSFGPAVFVAQRRVALVLRAVWSTRSPLGVERDCQFHAAAGEVARAALEVIEESGLVLRSEELFAGLVFDQDTV